MVMLIFVKVMNLNNCKPVVLPYMGNNYLLKLLSRVSTIIYLRQCLILSRYSVSSSYMKKICHLSRNKMTILILMS